MAKNHECEPKEYQKKAKITAFGSRFFEWLRVVDDVKTGVVHYARPLVAWHGS